MYGVVLMMALSGGADVPALNEGYAEPAARYGDHGHKEYRLFGGRRGGCCGGGGCYGGSYGCCGGGGACYGGSYGCCGGGAYYGGGCYGGCSGGYRSGGCCGGSYGSWGGGGYYGSWGGGGYYGAMPYDSGYGYSSWSTPIYGSSGLPILQSGYQYGLPSGEADRGYYDGNGNAPATVVVRLPADARLTFDDAATQSTGDMRTFVSPPLQPGKEYTYTLRAEMTRDGKKLERKREVTVRAGQTSDVRFDFAEKLPAPNP